MRAVRNTADGVRVVDVPTPDPAAGVRVRIRNASICGTDLSMLDWGPLPMTLGHEFAGVLDDGRAVAVQPLVHCGTCDRCTAGETAQCRSAMAQFYGVSRDGGMADEIVVDPSCISPLPDGVTLEDASLIEPLAVALHAVNRSGVEAGSRVAVIGAGTIGLLCASVAKERGADVVLAARHPAQRRAAEALGLPLRAGGADGGDGTGSYGDCDVVFEAAGSESAFADAVESARPGATIVLVSTTWKPLNVSFLRAQLKETTFVPAIVYGHAHGEREFDTAARLLAAHPEIPRAVVTHRFGLDDAAEAFRTAADRAAGAIKVVLEP